jgi:hypothetical protein
VTPGRSRALARLAMAAVMAHGLLFILLHLRAPTLGVADSLISDYARSEHGLTSAAYLAFATVWLALAGALGRVTLVPKASISIGRLLFTVAAVTIVLAAFDPVATDPRHRESLGAMRTLMSRFARPGLFVGIVLISLGVRRVPGWENLSGSLIGLAVAAMTVYVVTIVIMLNVGWAGLGQRVLFLVVYAWVLLVSGRLATLASAPASG